MFPVYDIGFLLRMGVCYNAGLSVNINLGLIPLSIMSVSLLYSESPQFPILDSVWMLRSLIQYDMLPMLCY